jgi:hypothetical protein
MTEEKEFREKVVVGLSVLWYPKALMDREPKAAMVVSANSNGSVNLFVLDEGGSYRVQACYHRSCKTSLYDQAGKKFPHVLSTGCWDFSEASALLYRMLKETQEVSDVKDCGVLVGQAEEVDKEEAVAEEASPVRNRRRNN